MASSSRQGLSEEIFKIVDSLKDQGVLDKNFGTVQTLKDIENPFFMAEIIPLFCSHIQIILRDLTQLLETEPVNYYDLGELCIKVTGCTSCFGARGMASASAAFAKAIENKNKDECALALKGVKDEFQNLRGRLEGIAQLERQALPLSP